MFLSGIFDHKNENFYQCFIAEDRWKMYLEGLGNTLLIALGACLLGILIGILITIVRVAPKTNPFVKVLDALAKLYITVIRGTPVVLQLMILYFVVLKSINTLGDGLVVAAIAFGVNSGAYMSEILRGGLLSVDRGQLEAGRSLGLSWLQTMITIVLPQGIKVAVPTMFNEFITLVKETSVAGYVGIVDLTRIQAMVTGQTSGAIFVPLIIIAAIYLIVVLILQELQKFLERRLARSER